MGKTKRMKPSQMAKVSLEQDIESAKFAKSKNRNKIRLRQDEEEQFVDSKISKKILSAAREQQREIEGDLDKPGRNKPKVTKLDMDIESDTDPVEDEDTQPLDTFYEDMKIDEADEKAIEMFMSKNPLPRRTLADIIMEKITERQTELETQFSDAGSVQLEELDPKIKHLYEGVGEVLKKYRSGKLPKAFKIVPRLKNWEQILYVTDPPSWSAAAMYQATRIFVSNLTEKNVELFFKLVLLPRVRDDLAEYKRLNFHLYQALHKALFKPGGFMKGILLPLLESGNCTLRESIIIGSVIAKNSIPVLYSSAAILKIAEMDYTGANSIFLRIFFDKKYALPYKVVDACVLHFVRFQDDPRELPVLWHQALLTFVQRYKGEISREERDSLMELIHRQTHHEMSAEIRRELQNAKCRDEEKTAPVMDLD